MSFEIVHLDQLGGTPYLAFATIAHHELLMANQCDEHVQLVGWDNRAVVANDLSLRECVGIITYNKYAYINSFGIVLGHVTPAFRRRGIYTLLWQALVAKAREEKMYQITGVTHVNNTRMREVAKSLGRVEESVNLRYYVAQ